MEREAWSRCYLNLGKSFYDANKPGLVETVCVVMPCDYHDQLNTS